MDNPFRISFCGGETLAREETIDLVAFAHDKRFETYITTSGYGLNADMIKNLVNAGIDEIAFSLETLNAKKHDSLRGTDGLFETIISSIDQIKRLSPRVRIGLNTIIMAENLDDLPALTRWVVDNPRLNFIGFQVITQPQNTPADADWFNKGAFANLWPSDFKKTNDILDELIAIKKESEKQQKYKIGTLILQFEAFKAYFRNPNSFVKEVRCNIYKKPLSINPYGGIEFCRETGSVGNIRKDNLRELWNGKRKDWVEAISRCKTCCPKLLNAYFDDAPVDGDLLIKT